MFRWPERNGSWWWCGGCCVQGCWVVMEVQTTTLKPRFSAALDAKVLMEGHHDVWTVFRYTNVLWNKLFAACTSLDFQALWVVPRKRVALHLKKHHWDHANRTCRKSNKMYVLKLTQSVHPLKFHGHMGCLKEQKWTYEHNNTKKTTDIQYYTVKNAKKHADMQLMKPCATQNQTATRLLQDIQYFNCTAV